MEEVSAYEDVAAKGNVSTTAFLQQHLGEMESAGVTNPLASSSGAYGVNAAYGQPELAAFSSAQAQSILLAQHGGLTPEQLMQQQLQQLQLAQAQAQHQ